MAKHIGVVAVSPEGSSICYRLIGRHVAAVAAPEQRPLVTLHNQPFPNYVDALRADDWEGIGRMLRDSARILADAGADFCILPDNVAHHALPLAEAGSPIPWLNMIDLVAEELRQNHCHSVGLIGTRYVTYGATYQAALGLRGIPLLVPEETEADAIDRIIFTEAVFGSVTPDSKLVVEAAIGNLRRRGCDSLILGSSEAGLMLGEDQHDLQVCDPLPLLARAAVNRALAGAEAEAA